MSLFPLSVKVCIVSVPNRIVSSNMFISLEKMGFVGFFDITEILIL